MRKVAVIGGGIAGLTASYRLEREGYQVVVLEAEERVGGVIRSERVDGYLVEHGPNSVQNRSSLLDRLVRELGLEPRRVRASEAARTRYVVKNGRPEPVPLAPTALLTSRLFGRGAKLRLLKEPFVPPADPAREESVAEFVRRRLGPEFVDYGMNPFVGGVYAGDPEQLSVRHAFPRLFDMEQRYGSILKGQMSSSQGAEGAAETHLMFSFENGLEELPAALAGKLTAVRTRTPATDIILHDATWSVNGDSYDAVVYTAPLYALPEMHLRGAAEALDNEFAQLQGVTYAPLSIVALGYETAHVGHSLRSFGMLVPEKEPFRILGTLFTSSIFPGRAPEGHAVLTSFVGGMRAPELARKSKDELVDIVHEDLARLLGIRTRPAFAHHVFKERSIPQYEIGYGGVLSAIDRLERTFAGWFMAGNYRNGVSVGEAADSGDDAARRCAAYLSQS